MNLREEEYILALAECGSITRAAEYLHVTQPTLSIFLTGLEKRIGIPLFHRIGRRLTHTPAGGAFIEHARKAMVMQNDFEKELSSYIKEELGELHIGCTYLGSLSLMPRLFSRMKEIHPNIRLILHDEVGSVLENMLADGTVDLIYTNLPIINDSFYRETIYHDHLLAVLPDGHSAQAFAQNIPGMRYPYLDLRHVAGEPFFLMKEGRAIRARIALALAYADVHPMVTYPLEHIEIGCQMAANGLGVAFTMESYVKSSSVSQQVRYFRVGDPGISTNWFLAYRDQMYIPSYAETFIALLRKYVQSDGKQFGTADSFGFDIPAAEC